MVTNAKNNKRAVISTECDPSLKLRFQQVVKAAGFEHEADCLRTVIRDLVSGRVHYVDSVLQSQG